LVLQRGVDITQTGVTSVEASDKSNTNKSNKKTEQGKQDEGAGSSWVFYKQQAIRVSVFVRCDGNGGFIRRA
jgi:hypothetical protein